MSLATGTRIPVGPGEQTAMYCAPARECGGLRECAIPFGAWRRGPAPSLGITGRVWLGCLVTCVLHKGMGMAVRVGAGTRARIIAGHPHIAAQRQSSFRRRPNFKLQAHSDRPLKVGLLPSQRNRSWDAWARGWVRGRAQARGVLPRPRMESSGRHAPAPIATAGAPTSHTTIANRRPPSSSDMDMPAGVQAQSDREPRLGLRHRRWCGDVAVPARRANACLNACIRPRWHSGGSWECTAAYRRGALRVALQGSRASRDVDEI